MKKLFSLLGALLLLAVPLMFTSCDDVPDNPVKPTPTPKAPTYRNDNYRPLTFEATKANITVTFKISGSNIAPSSVEYSLDKGATWTPLSSANQAILLANVGDMVMFRGNNASYNGEAQFVIASAASEARGGTRQLTMSDKLANAIGNIYSLVFGKSISGSIKLTAENANALKNILKDCPIDAISDDGARRLVASSRNLAPGVLEGFLSGTLITEAPDLTASVMEKDCYKDAFKDCPYVAKVTMLATKCADGLDPIDCLSGWMDNSGGEVPTGDDKIVILNKNAEASFLNNVEDQLPPGDTWEIVDTKGEEIETVAQYIVYDAEGTKSIKDIPEDAIELTGTIEATSLAAGTYVVSGEASRNGNLPMDGEVNLILKDGASLTVNGKISGATTLNIFGQEKSTGKLTIDNSEIDFGIIIKNVNIHGGVISITGPDQAIETGGTLNIYNGTITASGLSNAIMALGPLNVYNGELTATSTSGAAISLFAEEVNGVYSSVILTIYDGKVTATSAAASGINAYDRSGATGDIVIKGGTVKAIAGGDDGLAGIDCLSITISGGNVDATGGERGEGIYAKTFGDDPITKGTINISGGTVKATGGDGGGVGIAGRAMTISGSAEVTAIGGDGDTGISPFGGDGIGSDLTISGGTVKATGGNGADVTEGDGGNGGNGINGTITATGGSVTAKGGNGGKGGDSHNGGNGGHGVFGSLVDLSIQYVTPTGGTGGQAGEGGEAGQDGYSVQNPTALLGD